MSSRLDEEAVRHIAHLARLKTSEDEVALFAGQLTAILDYFAKLSELDTSDTRPTDHALGVSNVFREDRVSPGLDSQQALYNAPQQQDGFFRVPKVLDKNGS